MTMNKNNAGFGRTVRLIEMVLRIATSIADKVPSADDPPLRKLTKTLATIDAIRTGYRGAKAGFMHDMTDRYGLTTKTSPAFVRLFFATDLHTLFDTERFELDNSTIICARRGSDMLFFEEFHWGVSHVGSQFYHTPAFDFPGAVALLWSRYPHGLYVSIDASEQGYGHDMTFASVPKLGIERLTSKAESRLQRELAKHGQAQRRNRHLTYLCVGEPGSGKSAFATLFAQAVGGRPLKIDAAALPHMGVRELAFIIDALRPSALIIDDLDRAPMDVVSARVLFVLELIKGSFPTVPVLLTANDVTKLDVAMLRPKRIDVPLLFEAPDIAERTELLGPYAKMDASAPPLEPQRPARTMADLFAGDAGLTHAYIAEIRARLDDEPEAEVVESVLLLCEFATKARGSTKGPGGQPPSSEDPGSPPKVPS